MSSILTDEFYNLPCDIIINIFQHLSYHQIIHIIITSPNTFRQHLDKPDVHFKEFLNNKKLSYLVDLQNSLLPRLDFDYHQKDWKCTHGHDHGIDSDDYSRMLELRLLLLSNYNRKYYYCCYCLFQDESHQNGCFELYNNEMLQCGIDAIKIGQLDALDGKIIFSPSRDNQSLLYNFYYLGFHNPHLKNVPTIRYNSYHDEHYDFEQVQCSHGFDQQHIYNNSTSALSFYVSNRTIGNGNGLQCSYCMFDGEYSLEGQICLPDLLWSALIAIIIGQSDATDNKPCFIPNNLFTSSLYNYYRIGYFNPYLNLITNFAKTSS